VSDLLLTRAIGGDEAAFRALTDAHRRELQFHCYRMLGSMTDAEDALQETLIAAWRGLSGFERRASVRTWLYRIATNRCLNALRDAGRRPPPSPQPPYELPTPTRVAEPTWLDPYPDALLEGVADTMPGPAARYEARETVELAFIAALQQLPPRQRAVLVLRDVLGFHAQEVAAMLDASEDSVKSALKRARRTLEAAREDHTERPPPANSAQERELVRRFTDAFVADDIDALVALLTDEAWMTMPPATLEYQGPAAIGEFLRSLADWRQGVPYLTVPTRANSQPALACYRREPPASELQGVGVLVLTLAGERIAALTLFIGSATLERFGLPRTLTAP
jgi:RNA polymerase sigma-70 factor (TIGR02960 family)